MTLFGNYITVLGQAKVETSKIKIVKSLFRVTGAMLVPDDPVIKKWLYYEGNDCRTGDYFENGNINEDGYKGFINYFIERPQVSWKSLQDKFRSVDGLIAVDCTTSNKEDFYRSLLNEFLVWLKLPISKRQIDNDESKGSTSSKQMIAIFMRNIDECHIKDVMNHDPYIISRNFPSCVARFVKDTKFEIVHLYDKESDEPIYKQISQFIYAIDEYKDYIEDHTELTKGMISLLVPKHRFDGDNVEWQLKYQETTNYYRERIKSLYYQITGDATWLEPSYRVTEAKN